MDKLSALMKFQGMLNQLVSEKLKKDKPMSESSEMMEDGSLEAKGELLKKLAGAEKMDEMPENEEESAIELPIPAPEGMEAELEIEPAEDEMEDESKSPELPPELADMLAKILGQKQVKGTRDITSDVKSKKPMTVPVGGLSVTEIEVVQPKRGRKK